MILLLEPVSHSEIDSVMAFVRQSCIHLVTGYRIRSENPFPD
jgi:hypothetical protein